MKNDDITALNQIKIGEKCKVIYLDDACTNSYYRLIDLGVVENTIIIPLYKSMSSNTKAYYIKGSVLALREKDTQKIFVRRT